MLVDDHPVGLAQEREAEDPAAIGEMRAEGVRGADRHTVGDDRERAPGRRVVRVGSETDTAERAEQDHRGNCHQHRDVREPRAQPRGTEDRGGEERRYGHCGVVRLDRGLREGRGQQVEPELGHGGE